MDFQVFHFQVCSSLYLSHIYIYLTRTQQLPSNKIVLAWHTICITHYFEDPAKTPFWGCSTCPNFFAPVQNCTLCCAISRSLSWRTASHHAHCGMCILCEHFTEIIKSWSQVPRHILGSLLKFAIHVLGTSQSYMRM